MVLYLNTHAALEQMRRQAERDNERGPRVSHCATLSITVPMLNLLFLLEYQEWLGESIYHKMIVSGQHTTLIEVQTA